MTRKDEDQDDPSHERCRKAKRRTLPSENRSHCLSYMKYTLETQCGRTSMTPTATSSPSMRYS